MDKHELKTTANAIVEKLYEVIRMMGKLQNALGIHEDAIYDIKNVKNYMLDKIDRIK